MINTSGCSRVNYYILELTDAATCKCSVREGVLRNFATFAGKYLCQSLFSNEVAGLRSATLLKKRLWHSCFPVNFTKFLRTTFLQKSYYKKHAAIYKKHFRYLLDHQKGAPSMLSPINLIDNKLLNPLSHV